MKRRRKRRLTGPVKIMRCNKRVVSLTLRGTEGSSTLVERTAELRPHNCQACRE